MDRNLLLAGGPSSGLKALRVKIDALGRHALNNVAFKLAPRRDSFLVYSTLVVVASYLVMKLADLWKLEALQLPISLALMIVAAVWAMVAARLLHTDEDMAQVYEIAWREAKQTEQMIRDARKSGHQKYSSDPKELSAEHVAQGIQNAINRTADLLTARVGGTCAVTVKLLVNQDSDDNGNHPPRVVTFLRDRGSSGARNSAEIADGFDYGENTAFLKLYEDRSLRRYVSDDLLSLYHSGKYENSHPRWWERYTKTLVLPILAMPTAENAPIVGFLCVDCLTGSLQQKSVYQLLTWLPELIYTHLWHISLLQEPNSSKSASSLDKLLGSGGSFGYERTHDRVASHDKESLRKIERAMRRLTGVGQVARTPIPAGTTTLEQHKKSQFEKLVLTGQLEPIAEELTSAFAAIVRRDPELVRFFFQTFDERAQDGSLEESTGSIKGLTDVLGMHLRLLPTSRQLATVERRHENSVSVVPPRQIVADMEQRVRLAVRSLQTDDPMALIRFQRNNESLGKPVDSHIEALLIDYVENKSHIVH